MESAGTPWASTGRFVLSMTLRVWQVRPSNPVQVLTNLEHDDLKRTEVQLKLTVEVMPNSRRWGYLATPAVALPDYEPVPDRFETEFLVES